MYLPILVDLRGKKVLVVGYGKVGKRRAEKLRKAGALVTVIDKRTKAERKNIKFVQASLSTRKIPSLRDYFLVVAATDDKELNEAIAKKAKREGALINRADDFKGGDVIFPAFVRTRDGVISFTTLGKDPGLSKKIQEALSSGLSCG